MHQVPTDYDYLPVARVLLLILPPSFSRSLMLASIRFSSFPFNRQTKTTVEEAPRRTTLQGQPVGKNPPFTSSG